MIKGAEHMLKSTEWKKKTKKKDWSPCQCPNKSMVYICPANRELKGLSLLASVMFDLCRRQMPLTK